MSVLPTKQYEHPATNLPLATEHYQGHVPPMPDHMSAEWIDRKVENDSVNYRKPVTTGSDFIP